MGWYTGFERVLGSTFVAITLNKNNCNIFIHKQLEYDLDKIQIEEKKLQYIKNFKKDYYNKCSFNELDLLKVVF